MLSKQQIEPDRGKQEMTEDSPTSTVTANMQHIYSNLKTISQLLQPNNQSQNLLTNIFRKTIPSLSTSSHKGSSGRIAILGGSEKYTGAPYYTAMSALRTGADLATVYCAQEASTAIKTYSPELMVDPVYEACKMQQAQDDIDESCRKVYIQEMVQNVLGTLNRMHALVIGPGLGRDPLVMDASAEIIKQALSKGMSLVLDADALYLLSLEKYSWLIEEMRRGASTSVIVLTPNVVEYKRLVDGIANGSEQDFVNLLPGVIVVKKGHQDVIRRFPVYDVIDNTCNKQDGKDTKSMKGEIVEMVCEEQGGLKRSGGIGDILAGSIGTFLAWNKILSTDKKCDITKSSHVDDDIFVNDGDDMVLSCWLACGLTKRATLRAFQKRKRSMTAPDILEEIGESFNEIEVLAGDYSSSSSSQDTNTTELSL